MVLKFTHIPTYTHRHTHTSTYRQHIHTDVYIVSVENFCCFLLLPYSFALPQVSYGVCVCMQLCACECQILYVYAKGVAMPQEGGV